MVHFFKLLISKTESRQKGSQKGLWLPERPLAAQGQKNEFPHNNFNCRSYFFAGLEFPGSLRVAIPKLCNHQKQAGMRDCSIFLKLLDSEKKHEHETVALFLPQVQF